MSIEQDIASLRSEIAALNSRLDQQAQPIERKSYKIPEAAMALGVSERAVYSMIASGELRAVTLPGMTSKRVPVAALDELLQPRTKAAAS